MGDDVMSQESNERPRALISGGGFAGLTSAFWMRRLGYRVTVVETADALRKGGTPVDIRDDTIGIVDRMGILDAIRERSLPPRPIEFTNQEGGVEARVDPEPPSDRRHADGYEIPRDDLLAILLATLGDDDDVEVRFGSSISALAAIPDGIHATFRDGSDDDYDLVLGCDGNHSTVRRLWFGPEMEYSRFLHNYFTIAIVNETLIEQNTTQIVSLPGRTLLLNAYENKTDISLNFHADEEIPYDYHDVADQKRIVRDRFSDAGPRITELLEKAEGADNFYFDKLSQTKMPRWSSGRVVLVGDAGYCASPAAGMGGSLAIIGATALFDAFEMAHGDVDAGLAEYETRLRPVVEQIQATAVHFGVPTFFPATEEEIRTRNAHLTASR